MNLKKIGSIASLSLKVTAFVLLVLTPIAISFKPYYTQDKPGYPVVFEDPQYSLKAFFIALGLIGGVLAIISAIVYLISSRPKHKPQLVLHLSMTACAVALGLYVFPYCVNGILQVSLGNAEFGDFDPKRLMPTIWIGEIWSDITLTLSPLLVLMSFILVSMICFMVFKKT